MEKAKVDLMMFSIGAVSYGLMEVVWRGHTHWSMLGAGGICFLTFGKIREKFKHKNIVVQAAIGGITITTVELAFGLVFNMLLKKKVWDYSKMPYNFCGQICIPYTLLWMLISLFALPIAGKVKNRLEAICRGAF